MTRQLIAPSILSADFGVLAEEVKAVEQAGADVIHIDVMDGQFVSNLTIGPMIAEAVRKITTLPLDVHLMVNNPERLIPEFARAKADYISFHIEATSHAHGLIQLIQKYDIKAGVAINPATPLSAIEELIEHIDMLVVMSVNPGFGGQKFIETSCSKLKRARQMISDSEKNIELEIDGGVKTDNIKKIAAAGANMFVAGSAVFNSGNYEQTISEMKKEITGIS